MSGVIWPFTSMLRASPETSPSSLRFWCLLSTHAASGIFVVSIFTTSLGFAAAPSGRALWPVPWAGFARGARGKCETREGWSFR